MDSQMSVGRCNRRKPSLGFSRIGLGLRQALLALAVLAPVAVGSVPTKADSALAAWKSHMTPAGEAHLAGDYALAEQHYRAALALAERFDTDGRYLEESLSGLAGLYFAQGQYAEAAVWFRQAISIAEALFDPAHPKHSAIDLYRDLLTEAEGLSRVSDGGEDPPPRGAPQAEAPASGPLIAQAPPGQTANLTFAPSPMVSPRAVPTAPAAAPSPAAPMPAAPTVAVPSGPIEQSPVAAPEPLDYQPVPLVEPVVPAPTPMPQRTRPPEPVQPPQPTAGEPPQVAAQAALQLANASLPAPPGPLAPGDAPPPPLRGTLAALDPPPRTQAAVSPLASRPSPADEPPLTRLRAADLVPQTPVAAPEPFDTGTPSRPVVTESRVRPNVDTGAAPPPDGAPAPNPERVKAAALGAPASPPSADISSRPTAPSPRLPGPAAPAGTPPPPLRGVVSALASGPTASPAPADPGTQAIAAIETAEGLLRQPLPEPEPAAAETPRLVVSDGPAPSVVASVEALQTAASPQVAATAAEPITAQPVSAERAVRTVPDAEPVATQEPRLELVPQDVAAVAEQVPPQALATELPPQVAIAAVDRSAAEVIQIPETVATAVPDGLYAAIAPNSALLPKQAQPTPPVPVPAPSAPPKGELRLKLVDESKALEQAPVVPPEPLDGIRPRAASPDAPPSAFVEADPAAGGELVAPQVFDGASVVDVPAEIETVARQLTAADEVRAVTLPDAGPPWRGSLPPGSDATRLVREPTAPASTPAAPSPAPPSASSAGAASLSDEAASAAEAKRPLPGLEERLATDEPRALGQRPAPDAIAQVRETARTSLPGQSEYERGAVAGRAMAGRLKAQEAAYRRDIRDRLRRGQKTNPDAAAGYFKLARLYQRQGRYELASGMFKKALDIRIDSLAPDDPALLETAESYAKLLRQSGLTDRAKAVMDRVRDLKPSEDADPHSDIER